MTPRDFEELLTAVSLRLTDEVRASSVCHEPSTFENRVRAVLTELARDKGVAVDPSPQAQVFPDIVMGEFGIEVKVVHANSWRSIANSVFEGTRDPNVKHIYVLFGKMGGKPEVRWGRYENCVMHVRTSHVPRFEVDIDAKESLFAKFGISYQDFCKLSDHEKMEHIRKYARGRRKSGERLWWLEDKPEKEQEHSLDLQVRLYMNLSQSEKRQIRAEAALLCPQIVAPSRTGPKIRKYTDATLYMLTYRGVLAPQTRDLFSAGSVAGPERGGNYLLRALKDIEAEMKKAAATLEDALFVEYWGMAVPPKERIKQWLVRADGFAKGWRPSQKLFLGRK